MPKGLLPTILYSLLFLAVPLLWLYQPANLDDGSATSTRALAIASAVVGGLAIVAANDCVAWFNKALIYHVGIEAHVLDRLYAFAADETRALWQVSLAWIALVIIVAHLLPFLLTDRLGVLAFLAYVGMVLNATVAVFVLYDDFLLVALSSGMLLGTTILIAGIDCLDTSLLSTVRKTLQDGTWAVCLPLES